MISQLMWHAHMMWCVRMCKDVTRLCISTLLLIYTFIFLCCCYESVWAFSPAFYINARILISYFIHTINLHHIPLGLQCNAGVECRNSWVYFSHSGYSALFPLQSEMLISEMADDLKQGVSLLTERALTHTAHCSVLQREGVLWETA